MPNFANTQKSEIVLDVIYCIIYSVLHTVYHMAQTENLFENLRLELRRGCLALAVLAQLRQEHYGYTLRKALVEHGLEIEESTLYPLLRRLESQGLLVSEWREEDKRKKRFYKLSGEGSSILARLLQEWRRINASIDNIV